jgi:hypothetical protein
VRRVEGAVSFGLGGPSVGRCHGRCGTVTFEGALRPQLDQSVLWWSLLDGVSAHQRGTRLSSHSTRPSLRSLANVSFRQLTFGSPTDTRKDGLSMIPWNRCTRQRSREALACLLGQAVLLLDEGRLSPRSLGDAPGSLVTTLGTLWGHCSDACVC